MCKICEGKVVVKSMRIFVRRSGIRLDNQSIAVVEPGLY